MSVVSDDSKPVIYNSILWNDGPADEITKIAGLAVKVTYSDVRMDSGTYFGTGNINADPLLDADFRLMKGSPCIDTGTGTGAPSDDIDGDSRPQEGRVGVQSDDGLEFDMGYDEYISDGCTSHEECDDGLAQPAIQFPDGNHNN